MEALQCPLCYNGDITSPESLTQILTKLPSIDTVMIGRGILQNPGLLQELKAASTESVALPSCEERLAVLKEFAPEEMSEEAIRKEISEVLAGLGIEAPTGKDKGRIMKELMPRVKGKADGALVNKLVGEVIQ